MRAAWRGSAKPPRSYHWPFRLHDETDIYSLKIRSALGAHDVDEGVTGLVHIVQSVVNLRGVLARFVGNTFDYPPRVEACKISDLDA